MDDHQYRPNDPCPICAAKDEKDVANGEERDPRDGFMVVYSSEVTRDETKRIRYLRCNVCRHRPPKNKQIIPIEFAPRRRRWIRST